jgi:hypothetical protein
MYRKSEAGFLCQILRQGKSALLKFAFKPDEISYLTSEKFGVLTTSS